MRERVDAVIRGVVQGVGFRWFVRSHAQRLHLDGWTANMSDGSLRVVVEGPSSDLDDLLDVLHHGPSGASVLSVDASRSEATHEFSRFEIEAGGHSGD